MANPTLSNRPGFNNKTLTAEELQRIYDQPAAKKVDNATNTEYDVVKLPAAGTPGLMTYNSVLTKGIILFLFVLAGAYAGWQIPKLLVPGIIIGLVFGFINAFKKEPSPPLMMIYAIAEGAALGAISRIFEAQYEGIVFQAILATFSVFAAVFLLFRNGKVRTSPKMTKIFMVAMVGYTLFSLLNLILVWTNVLDNPWGMRAGWFGIAIGVFAVLLASYSLVMDFEFIKNGVNNRIPEKWSWTAAFGLIVTLVWLYLELLRILAIFRGN